MKYTIHSSDPRDWSSCNVFLNTSQLSKDSKCIYTAKRSRSQSNPRRAHHKNITILKKLQHILFLTFILKYLQTNPHQHCCLLLMLSSATITHFVQSLSFGALKGFCQQTLLIIHMVICTNVLLSCTRPVILSAYTDSDILYVVFFIRVEWSSLETHLEDLQSGVWPWANKTRLMEGEAKNTGGRSDEPESHPSQTQNRASSNHIRHAGWCMSREVTRRSSYSQHSSTQEISGH